MKTNWTLTVTLALLFLTPIVNSANTLDKKIERYVTEHQFPGAVTMIMKDDKIIHYSSVGYNNIKQKKELKKNDVFRIYSMTKPIVSVAVLQLVQQGKIKLDEDIRTYLPDFEPFEFDGKEHTITVHQLLSHTAGLGYFGGFSNWVDFMYLLLDPNDRDNTTDGLISDVSGIGLKHKPGAQWRYSIASDIQGALIEKVTGQRLGDYLKQHIFDPLEMNDTAFWVAAANASRLVDMYEYEDGEVSFGEFGNRSEYLEEPSLHSGGGGLISTTSDYAKFVSMLMHKGQYKNHRILSESLVNTMLSSHTENMDTWLLPKLYPGTGFGYGLGVKEATDGHRAKGSFYWAGKGGTFFWADPSQNLVVVVMTQLEDGWRKMDRWLVPEVYALIDNMKDE
ncbi:serine hydrolase [Pleionea sp. CnH1-48]|uniref:serine hydrolase domain-containing protein n=1 Tax=Pleionea sp. CnH1-48 TaxID=2954494 RepID=UPI002097E53F|nr:serine hydrolase domain-containing protein [Pleionea sp. CnH1-48]MCO7223371.1 beta-lactamase family protein [Pleionea sp. CnH1-48]